jgi:UDP-N-acetylglucosamine 2-epimerase (non-hydrolysing)
MIDSLVAFQDHFATSTIKDQLNLDRPYALMTFHRPSNVDENDNLKNLVLALEKVSDTLDCVFPIHPRTRTKLDNFGFLNRLQLNPRFHILDPIGYIDFMRLQKDASVILTDSGGLQEESTFFGVPCLTVRDNTERPVTITHGTNKLIGTEYAKIPNEVQQAISIPEERSTRPELWDGKAAKRIAEILRDNLIRNI